MPTAICSPPKLYSGSRPTVEFTHWDIEDNLADPSTIEVRYGLQGGTVATVTHPDAAITQESTGVWRFTFPTGLAAGTYWVTIEASGGGNTITGQIKVVVHGLHS